MTATTQKTKAATKAKNDETKIIPSIISQQVRIPIVGVTTLIQHKWSEKALKQIRDKKAGVKTRARDVCDPHTEMLAATYFDADGCEALPAVCIKNAIIGAAHKDLGIEKTLVRKSIFIEGDLLPLEFTKCLMREDYVRVGSGGADLRYRPEFFDWSCEVVFSVDITAIPVETLISLINRAGFGVGICEWRPEKGGEHGRFKAGENIQLIGETTF